MFGNFHVAWFHQKAKDRDFCDPKRFGLDSGPLEVEHHWLNAGRDFQLIRQHLQDARAAFFLNPIDEVSFKKWRKSNFWALVFWDQQKRFEAHVFLGWWRKRWWILWKWWFSRRFPPEHLYSLLKKKEFSQVFVPLPRAIMLVIHNMRWKSWYCW